MWKNLNVLQKFLFITAICLVVPFAPEFIFLADLGGIELVFGFLMLYYQPIIIRIQSAVKHVQLQFTICINAIKNSAAVQPKVYFVQALFYSCAIVVSGSILYSSMFFLPALFLNGVLV